DGKGRGFHLSRTWPLAHSLRHGRAVRQARALPNAPDGPIFLRAGLTARHTSSRIFMERNVALVQGAALRALAEGAEPTLALLADASQRSIRTLMRQAEKEGWKVGCAPPENIAARVRSTAAVLVGRLEAAG